MIFTTKATFTAVAFDSFKSDFLIFSMAWRELGEKTEDPYLYPHSGEEDDRLRKEYNKKRSRSFHSTSQGFLENFRSNFVKIMRLFLKP